MIFHQGLIHHNPSRNDPTLTEPPPKASNVEIPEVANDTYNKSAERGADESPNKKRRKVNNEKTNANPKRKSCLPALFNKKIVDDIDKRTESIKCIENKENKLINKRNSL